MAAGREKENGNSQFLLSPPFPIIPASLPWTVLIDYINLMPITQRFHLNYIIIAS